MSVVKDVMASEVYSAKQVSSAAAIGNEGYAALEEKLKLDSPPLSKGASKMISLSS